MKTLEKTVIKNVNATQERIFNQILRWDMTREKEYLKNKQGYIDSDYLNQMELEYKKFVFLMTLYTDKVLPISENIDDMWHIHVLNTKRYAKFCVEATERLIHHNPTVNEQENLDLMPQYIGNTLPSFMKKHFWQNQ